MRGLIGWKCLWWQWVMINFWKSIFILYTRVQKFRETLFRYPKSSRYILTNFRLITFWNTFQSFQPFCFWKNLRNFVYISKIFPFHFDEFFMNHILEYISYFSTLSKNSARLCLYFQSFLLQFDEFFIENVSQYRLLKIDQKILRLLFHEFFSPHLFLLKT